MSLVARRCAVPGCGAPAPYHVLCPPHWKHVPAAVRRALFESLRAGQLRGTHPTARYQLALFNAIKATGWTASVSPGVA